MADKDKTEKNEKPVSKSAPKVFDIAKPNKQTPTATARPIIVTNRPIMQDPMMTSMTPTAPVVQDKPVPASSPDLATSSVAPSSFRVVIKPLADSENEKPAETEITTDTGSSAIADQPEINIPAPDELPAENDKDTTGPPESESGSGSNIAETEQSSAAAESRPVSADIESLTPEKDLAAKETAALEAAAKEAEENERLIDSKEYFLPINAVERRRSKVMIGLGLLLVVLLAVLLTGLLLDTGLLKIEGVDPLTDFFGA